MRKVTTILCSIAFMVSGIMMAITASDPSPGTSYKTIAAATMPSVEASVFGTVQDTTTIDLPEDLVRELAKKKGVLDTVYITKTDTIQVPVYYLATQVGNKEGPTGECIPIYEVRKVDEICPETTNSSVNLSNESDNDVGM